MGWKFDYATGLSFRLLGVYRVAVSTWALAFRYYSAQSPSALPNVAHAHATVEQRHGQAPNASIRHVDVACGRRSRSRDRRAGHADLPDDVVCLSRSGPRGGVVQHGARGTRVRAHLQYEVRGSG